MSALQAEDFYYDDELVVDLSPEEIDRLEMTLNPTAPQPAMKVNEETGEHVEDPAIQAVQNQQGETRFIDFSKLLDGEDFVFGDHGDLKPVWGTDDLTVWAEGEALMIAAPQGMGKTTIAHQLVKGLLGLQPKVLNMPVRRVAEDKNVLVLACDRPSQAARSLRRMFDDKDPDHRAVLKKRLRVWKGPLPVNLLVAPSGLLAAARAANASVIVVDSIKDVIPKISDDESGVAYNTAIQMCMANGVDVVDLHHTRKTDDKGQGKAKTVDDIYGSTWLTSGHGSIITLHGQTGDSVVSLTQVKMVNEQVGPLTIVHDHDKGETTIHQHFSVLKVLEFLEVAGLSAPEAAAYSVAPKTFTENDKQKMRRALKKLVKDGLATETPGHSGGVGGGTEARFHITAAGKKEAKTIEGGLPVGGIV